MSASSTHCYALTCQRQHNITIDHCHDYVVGDRRNDRQRHIVACAADIGNLVCLLVGGDQRGFGKAIECAVDRSQTNIVDDRKDRADGRRKRRGQA